MQTKLFYGWIVAGCVCTITFFAFGSAYTFTTFFESYQVEFNTSRSATSLVFAIAGFIYFSLGAVSGQIADRLGARWVIVSGIIVIGLGLLLSSFARSVSQIYLFYGIGMGVGVGLAYVPSVGVVQRWFIKKKASRGSFTQPLIIAPQRAATGR